MSSTTIGHFCNVRESISNTNNKHKANYCQWGCNGARHPPSLNELREERTCTRQSRPDYKVSLRPETASQSPVECCYLRSRAHRRRSVNLVESEKPEAAADSASGVGVATSLPCLADVSSTALPAAAALSVEGTPSTWLGLRSAAPFGGKPNGSCGPVKKCRRTRCNASLSAGTTATTRPISNALLPSVRLQKRLLHALLTVLLLMTRLQCGAALLSAGEPTFIGLSDAPGHDNAGENVVFSASNNNNSPQRSNAKVGTGVVGGSVGSGVAGGYLDKLNNLERSVAAVLIKVAYGTTSTTKRSIPDNSYVPSLTTIATPLLTTLRYAEKSSHQQQINLHHRNYELDLERDHALPTSAPNADILKSNSNPTYPNPNRHHNHDRERHRHLLNSTPLPSLPNMLKKNGVQSPTIPMYPADIPSYSPPARSFFTPPLPPEYQNPFADKPTLRGTNNEGIVANTGTYINRRPIPPPSLMPGHERIPFRPPDLAASTGGGNGSPISAGAVGGAPSSANPISSSASGSSDADRKKALNTPSRGSSGGPTSGSDSKSFHDGVGSGGIAGLSNQPESTGSSAHNTRKEVLPSIRRILNGSNGNKGEIPEVLLKQVTSRPIISYHQPPSSPVVLIDNSVQQNEDEDSGAATSNINKSKNISNSDRSEYDHYHNGSQGSQGDASKLSPKTKMSTKSTELVSGAAASHNSSISSTPSAAAAVGEAAVAAAAATSTSSTTSATDTNSPTLSSSSSSSGSSSSSSTAAAAAAHATWTIAWNIHVYLSVILFTILAVYSFYKMLTYNKLTHLFSQSYFVCIHLILLIICTTRIFYLCYDAYNIHSSFHMFVSELLLNLPATFLTISFSVLILFLFLKSLNHKNNRYSALIRPLTVVVGCGVHVVLCITLHYVESYTMQNHQQQLYYQQQQQLYRRQQQQQYLQQQHHQQYLSSNLLTPAGGSGALHQSAAAAAANVIGGTPPPRVLSLICQIIYIFICLSLGLLYLYLYRILKRILRSKSQNYIHGYQNLSYAIHITIATALLFVLLAALQIFGAISISTTRPLIAQLTAEIDWLQWGYQFSLRLIEIAIITLISWVAGLKTSGSGGGASVGIGIANGDSRLGTGAGGSAVFGTGAGPGSGREKNGHHHHHHNHSNVAGFFLPCTSSSSQEQFDTDYPAVCNANTNLHTYTMRTGKLIYDDSFALNSLAGQPSQVGGGGGGTSGRCSEFQLQQPTYQRPYDTGSIHSSANHTVADYAVQGTLTGGRYHHDMHQYADYLTDGTTDHYENPNFDLRGSGSGSGVTNSTMQKFTKTSTTSTTASSSGGSGSSAASQQQMLLLQNDNCYSEPLQPSCNASANYDFNNFERPKPNAVGVGADNQQSLDCWPESHGQPMARGSDKREKKNHHATLDRSAYENPERRSSNSTHSCASSSGGRYASYNSFERGHYNGVRKSGTLNNIVGGGGGGGGVVVGGGGIIHGRNSSSSSAASSNVSTSAQRASGVQTLAMADRHHYGQQQHSQRSGRAMGRGAASREHDIIFGRSSLERSSGVARPTHQPHHQQQQQQQHQANSDDEIMLTGSNVERTNLINNEDGSCLTTNSSTTTPDGVGAEPALCPPAIPCERLLGKASARPITEHALLAGNAIVPGHHHHHHASSSGPDSAASTMSATSSSVSESATSGSMLVAEHGFVRFRALDDINNAQGVGIHNASIRNQGRTAAVAAGQSPATAAAATTPGGKTAAQQCVVQSS